MAVSLLTLTIPYAPGTGHNDPVNVPSAPVPGICSPRLSHGH